MIGIPELVSTVIGTLSPLLPYLAKAGVLAGKALGDAVAKAGGEAAWQTAGELWERLNDAAAEDAKLGSALSLVSADPDDQNSTNLLSKILAARLEKDEALTQSLLQDIGGEPGIQRMIAERESRISNAAQHLQGPGEQTITARDSSTIENVTQTAKR